MKKCHYVIVKGERHLIRYCWPVIHSGDKGDCDCHNEFPKETIEQTISKMKDQIKKLEQRLEQIEKPK